MFLLDFEMKCCRDETTINLNIAIMKCPNWEKITADVKGSNCSKEKNNIENRDFQAKSQDLLHFDGKLKYTRAKET